jgi:phosphoribosylanthranilate isomerase
VEYGADAIGFVFTKSPRQVSAEAVQTMSRALPPFIVRVGVFVDESPCVLAIAKASGLDVAQLHGDQSDEFALSLTPHLRVIRALRVRDEESVTDLSGYRTADAYLLDRYQKDKLGGTGTPFDWRLALIAKRHGKPIIMAGGLAPDNVVEAVITVKPYGVDVSTGIESKPGKKDHVKMKEFIENVRAIDKIAR